MNPAIPRDQLLPSQETHLREYLRIIRRRKVLFSQVFVLTLIIGAAATLVSKPIFQASAKFLVPLTQSSISFTQDANPLVDVLRPFSMDSIPTQLQLIQQPENLEAAYKAAGVKHAASVQVNAVRDTNIIEVSAEGEDPKEVASLANEVVKLHLARIEKDSGGGLVNAIAFTKTGKDDAAKRLKKAEDNLISFRKEHKLLQANTEQEARIKEVLEVQARAREMESNVTGTQAQITQLEAELRGEKPSIAADTSRENVRRQKLQEKLDDYKDQLRELARDYEDTAPQVVALKGQISDLEEQLKKEPDSLRVPGSVPNPIYTANLTKLGELKASLQGFIAARNQFQAKLAGAQAQLRDTSPMEVQLSHYVQERDAAQADFNKFSDTLRTLEIRKNAPTRQPQQIGVAQIPIAPIRPHKAANLAMTILVALGLAIGMVFLQEYLDDRLNTPDDLENISVLPALAHVPLMPATEPRLVTALPANSHLAESYRALRASIGFAGVDTPIKRLQITSASKGEGKSVTSLNLATAMAMDGKRVVLVDADMRRPSLHRMLNLPETPGLSEMLVGMCSVEEALRPTDVENLQVICAGAIPPNPAELLGSQAFDQIIARLEENADILIVDSPPCMPVTDPLVIAPRMDGVLLVIHAGNTRKAGVKHVENLLRRARARLLGVVFNQVQADRNGYYYYSYYYSGDGYYSQSEEGKNGKAQRRKLPLGRGNDSGAKDDHAEKL